MKKVLLILLLLTLTVSLHAAHIAGGELQYKYLGPGAGNTDRYALTMRLFRECSSNGPRLENEVVNVGAYSAVSNTLQGSALLNLAGGLNIIKLSENTIPCLVGSPNVCYQVAVYTGEIELPRTANGYTLAWARCCRANGLMNASGQLGATYIAKIPGTMILPVGVNSSPEFVVKDTALVCGANDFVLDFGASDPDGDSLSYSFCDAFIGGSSTNQQAPPPNSLSLQPLPYGSPYSGYQPLGPGVTIDAKTGIISGVAPAATGRYVVNVCVTEWREGVPISQHRKDFILKVGDCNIIAAKLSDEYINCSSFTSSFQNEANSSDIRSYFWNFGVTTTLADTSTDPSPTYIFPDTGVYRITLVINRNEECSDTASAFVRVFPGFTPAFNITGSCYQNPFQFTDATVATYGTVNNWSWDFGVAGEAGDTSHLQHASYQYATQGDKMVRLIVKSSKGCNGVIEKPASVTDKPYLNLPFRDTLICSIDSLPLIAQGNGIFSWTPNHNIVNAGSANPVVFPKDTMVYVVELNESGCRNKDSIRVNVLDYITVTANADTAICRTDSINLSVTSHALSFQWEPSEGLNDATTKNPGAAPFTTTTYQVTANLGKCQAKDSVTVRVSPYPQVQAGADTSICFGDRVQLNATANCLDHSWFPSLNMLNPTSLQPQAAPSKTTVYIISAAGYDECPKAVHDTVVVTVIPPVKAFAGNDTIITGDEPLVLQASGGLHYSWSPASYLNDPGIANPLVLLSNNIDSMRYQLSVTTAEGCKGEDDISIVVFKTGPQIFVPDAFTPNKDLRNDLLYPVVVGMKHLDFFRVYNRYGQLIFSTSEIGKGWDGTFAGREQAPGTYVFMAQAVNYKGETVFKKGTVLLLR